MPAIITHDFFGRDVYATCACTIGLGADAHQAFLLGNQGPDPLFYLALHPLRMRKHLRLGNALHRANSAKVLVAFRESLDEVDESEREIGRAYVAGFLCHYLLDSALHPFVYSQQYALCNAGVSGLDESDGGKVHMLIERELDEICLFSKSERTVATFRPHEEILQASSKVLSVIGRLFSAAVEESLGAKPTPLLFPLAVKGFRTGQRFFYSHKKARGRIIPALETAITRSRYSFYSSLSHRANPSTQSAFANAEHEPWTNPFTQSQSKLGFWDLYGQALKAAEEAVPIYLSPDFSAEDVQSITLGVNFLGQPNPL